ncbi:MAG: hypothetical protein LBC97_14595 [Bifidobacteriaceae bacterium]|jgi:hypothetical protein|nr:hypothetical protein [Bifidobacteriaceae bacterium]
MSEITRADLERVIEASNGVLRPEVFWNSNFWTPSGRRMNLPDDQVDRGEAGEVVERWLASTTEVDGPGVPPGTGLSTVQASTGDRFLLKDAEQLVPGLVMGAEYAATHSHLGRLCKILDYGYRIPMHIHPPQVHADLVHQSSKDEAYYFPSGVDMGPQPETFLGVHPWLVGQGAQDLIHEELVAWDSDEILAYSRGYKQMYEEGFYAPSGLLHAPGSALTIELQESADTISLFQAWSVCRILDKAMLYKNITEEDKARLAERAPMRWVDWELNADPDLYAKLHISPVVFSEGPWGSEAWIFHGNYKKFSGKRLIVKPGAKATVVEKGAYNLLAWKGTGTIAGETVTGQVPGQDELFLCHPTATQAHEVVNTGSEDLVIVKFFGPDVNPDAPACGVDWDGLKF